MLTALLAGSPPPQLPLPLPRMPRNGRHLRGPPGWLKGNDDRISRHNNIRDVVFTAAQSAAFAPSKEAPGLVTGSLSRPGDVFLPSCSCGRPAALDIHMISPQQQQTFSEASVTPGHALQVGVQRKLTSNLPACREAGVECIPIVAETLGGLTEDAILYRPLPGPGNCRPSRLHGPYIYHQTYFPEVHHCPLAGQCVPLVPSPSNPPILSGWCRLTLLFHLYHASHAFVFILFCLKKTKKTFLQSCMSVFVGGCSGVRACS